MKQVLIRKGQVVVEEVPAPSATKGCVLVQVHHSCISVGTEVSGMQMSGLPLWKRALKQPHNVKKAMKMAATYGFKRTHQVITGQLAAGTPTGYSAAGTVIAVGEDVEHFQVGDRVACAGAQCAYHAEFICVPRNLCCVIPNDVSFEDASTVTVGAIALQGVRRVIPTLGETFVVIGLGLLGQLTTQILKANGCHVIGIDLNQKRIDTAMHCGLDHAVNLNEDQLNEIGRLTGGIGADGVIITATTSTNDVIAKAFQMCRKKGRVVLVGVVGLNINRADMYEKELDFYISTSYGPGRYDPTYEEDGHDYPIGYVRWTENRNMQAYLKLISQQKINLKPLITKTYPLSGAPEAYACLEQNEDKPLMVLLEYSQGSIPLSHKITYSHTPTTSTKQIPTAFIGPGNFAKAVLLPLIEQSKQLHLDTIISRTGHNAKAIAKQYQANTASTDIHDCLNDPVIKAVFIATRHDQHANNVLSALQAGKHVFVEKPLALNQEELTWIENFYQHTENFPVLLTGFNRRFSKSMTFIKSIVEKRTQPMIINYRMNAGFIPQDSWVHRPEGGGRNLGEACHIYDCFTYLTQARVKNIHASSIKPSNEQYGNNDNFVATITFDDGSIATLTYTALGSTKHPKEQMEVFVDGKVIVMNDYKEVSVAGARYKSIKSKAPQKGHAQEIKSFADCLINGGDWPIPLWQQIQATQIALVVEKQIHPFSDSQEVSTSSCAV